MMQKIDKSNNLSTIYKAWLDSKEAAGENHPKYEHSKTKRDFYNDIKFDLLRCQNGLCAYTEMVLCDDSILTEDNWVDGKYNFIEGVTEGSGQLEHFDESLKPDKAWLWDNLFMADDRINKSVKGKKSVDYILKPDLDGYDPLDMMEFNIELNIYIANSNKTPDEKRRINEMIETLGINYPGHVWKTRKGFLTKILKEVKTGAFDIDDYENSPFPTVVRFITEQYIPNREL